MIRVTREELAALEVDAVLRPVSAEWEPVTAAMRRLDLAAGPEPQEYCTRMGELPVGSALITPAGELRAGFMVHVIVRSLEEPVSEAGVRRGLRNGLRRLQEWAIARVAMPPIGTGAGNLDAEDVARLMVEECDDHALTADYPSEVLIAVENDYEYDAFQRALAPRDLPWLSERAEAGRPAPPRDDGT